MTKESLPPHQPQSRPVFMMKSALVLFSSSQEKLKEQNNITKGIIFRIEAFVIGIRHIVALKGWALKRKWQVLITFLRR
jgi:hypothetical protein